MRNRDVKKTDPDGTPRTQEFKKFIYSRQIKKEQEEKEKEERKEKKAAQKAEYAKKKIEGRYTEDQPPGLSPPKTKKGFFGSVKGKKKPKKTKAENGKKKPKKVGGRKKKAPKVPKSLSSQERASVLLHHKVARDEETDGMTDGRPSKERRLTKGPPPKPPGTETDTGGEQGGASAKSGQPSSWQKVNTPGLNRQSVKCPSCGKVAPITVQCEQCGQRLHRLGAKLGPKSARRDN